MKNTGNINIDPGNLPMIQNLCFFLLKKLPHYIQAGFDLSTHMLPSIKCHWTTLSGPNPTILS
jgi:hypothetical protein